MLSYFYNLGYYTQEPVHGLNPTFEPDSAMDIDNKSEDLGSDFNEADIQPAGFWDNFEAGTVPRGE